MSAICPNCKAHLSCGCQLSSASNGVRVCTLCRGNYEKQLQTTKQTSVASPTTPTQIQATPNNPFRPQ
jgi:hypothetical protein